MYLRLSSKLQAFAAKVSCQLGNGADRPWSVFSGDRHWRNAPTHTLHDPVPWKYYAVGNYFLNNINPPRHPWL